jgi:formyltetrahydrofolate synthetase
VIAARDRGIYVGIMLFEGWYLRGSPTSFQYHPFHGSNNVNGINGDANGNGEGEETHTLQVQAVVDLQKAYVRKVIDTVNDLDNVLYEIANESAVKGSTQWQYELIKYIKTYQATKPKQHPVGMTCQAWSLSADHKSLWNSPADWVPWAKSRDSTVGKTRMSATRRRPPAER